MGANLNRRQRIAAIVTACAAVGIIVAVIALASGGEGQGDAGDSTVAATSTTAVLGAAELEQLADGVILAGFDGSDPGADIVGDVAEHPYGGVLVQGSNWDGSKGGSKLIAAIREAGSGEGADPPLIAVAQEGGPYRALDDLPPGEREIEIGDAGDPELAAKWMEEAAKALRDDGFDLDLAPVADVATLDSPIADRAFSDDPAVAAQMTEAAVGACEDAGIACAPSHFPGLGGATQDTDAGPASVGLDAGTLADRDLLPFRAAFRAGAPAVVVSSAFYSAYDPVTPASLTEAIATDLLRDELKFKGVAISDDLASGAIRAVATPGDAAPRALAAGIDLVQVSDPGAVGAVRKGIVDAVRDGSLTEERLREAAGRVAALRKQLDG
ncbi:MAG: glycoside hydrolase family 3 N-terminal domain-containing protein [Solirubrobacterales bacterium]